jgi:hypothetical protein
MSEGHGDPPGDVRSFLPRPGEPVEQYAERLRGLHRDLTLVLQAVERGLAAAARPEPEEPREIRVGDEPAGHDNGDNGAEEPHEPVEVVPREPAETHAVAPQPPPAPPRTDLGPGIPRVEVLPPRSGERRRVDVDVEDERREGPQPWAEGERGADQPEGAVPPVGAGAERARRQRFADRPSAAAAAPAAEPEWVEHQPSEETFTAATFAPPPPEPGRFTASPVVIAALAAGWLTVLALILALLFN